MDAFGFNENYNEMKAENNTNSTPRFLCFREIKKLFRIAEIFLILVFATWVTSRLPFAVRISGEYFRKLLNVVVSPLFIFLLGNLIALTLFYKSRHLSHHHEIQAVDLDFMEVGPSYFTGEMGSPASQSGEKEIVYQDKETILEVTTKVVNKVHRRSHSENFSRTEKCGDFEESGCGGKKLRRSETEKRQRVAVEEVEVVDEMSNEEFQRAIEDFIAKQIKFHQEEKLAIVLHNSNA